MRQSLQQRTADMLHEAIDSYGLAVPHVQVEHTVSNGLYRRSIQMKAGVLYLGLKHKRESQWIALNGSFLLRDADLGTVTEVVGISKGITQVGTQRIMFCTADCEFEFYLPIPIEMGNEYLDGGGLEAIENYAFYKPNPAFKRLNFTTGCLG